MHETQRHSLATFNQKIGSNERETERPETRFLNHAGEWWNLLLSFSRLVNQIEAMPGPKPNTKKLSKGEKAEKEKADKERALAVINEAAKKGAESWAQLVKSEQAKGTIPPLTATMLGLYKQERSGATGGISTESWIQMYPAALDPKINYLEGTGTGGRVKKSEATQKVKDDIAKWKAKNVCFNDMFNIVLEINSIIDEKIDSRLEEFDEKITDELDALKERIAWLEADRKEKEKEIRVMGYVNREIMISGEDWREFEGDFTKLKKKATEFLLQFMKDKSNRDFVRSVNKVQGTDTNGRPKEYFRYRVIVANETLQTEICDKAAKDQIFRYKIKAGKSKSRRDVSKKKWPLTCASHEHNYRSMLEYRVQLEHDPESPNLEDIDLFRIEKSNDEGTKFHLARYHCEHDKVRTLFGKMKRGELQSHPQYNENPPDEHHKHIPSDRSP